MHTHRIRAAAHKACRAGVMIAGIQFATVGLPALGQTTPAATPGAADNAPSEAARRAAASPYRFILLNATAPPRAKPVAAPAEARRPAPTEQTASARPTPPVARAAEPTQAPAAAPEPVPVAALTPTKAAEPEPIAAVRREIIPIKTDDPRLPPALLRERPSGLVKVSFEIHPNGSTSGVKVVASNNRALNRASIEAVAGWKFQPVDEVLVVETEIAYNFAD